MSGKRRRREQNDQDMDDMTESFRETASIDSLRHTMQHLSLGLIPSLIFRLFQDHCTGRLKEKGKCQAYGPRIEIKGSDCPELAWLGFRPV
jgi:hypothetical protein